MTAVRVNLHGVLTRSRANGPGTRTVIWFQGCTLGCKGCFNPHTHGRTGGHHRSVEALVDDIAAGGPDVTGITVSGGEPFQQPLALERLLEGVRARTGLSVIVFSGYRLEEIEAMERGCPILSHVDVLIAGRYVPTRHSGKGLLGSTNQALHFLTGHYGLGEFTEVPQAEIEIDAIGRVTITGVAPPQAWI